MGELNDDRIFQGMYRARKSSRNRPVDHGLVVLGDGHGRRFWIGYA